MTEDKLEGTGLPAHGLVFLDVSWVLALPLYLYVEPWGSKLGVKASTKSVSPERQESFLDSRARRQGSRRLDPDARDPGVSPLDSAKLPLCFPKTLWAFPFGSNKVFLYPNILGNNRNPSGEFRNPSRDQTLLSHISVFIFVPFRSSSSCP